MRNTLLLTVIAAAMISASGYAEALSLTEVSDTQLGASFGTVENVGPDHWRWSFPIASTPNTLYTLMGSGYWAEPDSSTSVNRVIMGLAQNELSAEIYSDMEVGDPSAFGAVPDGTLGQELLMIGLDGGGSFFLSVYFTDGANELPDTGSSGLLLLGAVLSVAALSSRGARRFSASRHSGRG